jgi:pimeloyl-ACP methyl ester carboxylesterase
MRTHDGIDLHVVVHGPDDAPLTIVLAHCWTADVDDWHYQVSALMGRYGHGIRILTWDHRGHGRSGASLQADCTVETLARDMAALIDAHAPEGPVVLAGHSIGGMTMMALAEQRPDIVERARGALFVATSSGALDTVTLGLPELGPRLKAQIPRMLAHRARRLSRRTRRRTPAIEGWVVARFLFGEPMRPRDAGLVVDQLINCPPATMRGFYEDFMTHARTDALKAYDDVPTVVLVGDRDVLTPLHHAREIARAVRGARLVVAPGAGHMLPLERHELVTAELAELVDRALADG